MARTISRAYLSGWEYNRLLQVDPLEPRISALPAASLWKGAHQFWLFENVLCTRESIDNECAAADALGWATGSIVREFVAAGVIESVDWATLPHPVAESMRRQQEILRAEYSAEDVRGRIAQRDTTGLEAIKNRLLQPVLRHFDAMASGAPNSLATWSTSGWPQGENSPSFDVGRLLARLAAPLLPGVTVCRPPGVGLPRIRPGGVHGQCGWRLG